jgi:hypothetical protein
MIHATSLPETSRAVILLNSIYIHVYTYIVSSVGGGGGIFFPKQRGISTNT